jgi:Asp-tRNA(Asn)/Glu-tRNA(Gln) amidotransferase C subunit
MPDEAEITAAIVRQLAEIAGMDLDQSRAAELAPQIDAIRADIRSLSIIDLTGVEPLLPPARQERPSER